MINPYENKIFSSEFFRGKQDKPTLFFRNFGVDSNLVTDDDKYVVLQIKIDSLYNSSRKIVDAKSNRSLNHIETFNVIVVKEWRIFIAYFIQYTFTEAEFELAKQ